MTLLESFFVLTDDLGGLFARKRTHRRAVSLMLAALLCINRRWVTRLIALRGRDQQDWSADYKLFSRSPWDPKQLFLPILIHSLPYFAGGPIVVALDEVRVRRGGRRVKRSRWTRDPLSPPFHTNFMKGIRFLQISLLLPLHHTHAVGCRAIPIAIVPIDRPPRPPKRATPEQLALYATQCQQQNMCRQAVRELHALRALLDQLGAADQPLIVAVDGGFCNRTLFRADLPRIVLVARARKDAVLCKPAAPRKGSRRRYAKRKFTPESVRTNPAIPWQKTAVFYGGKRRTLQYSQCHGVLWQGGAGLRPLRLLVVAPTPYQRSPNAPKSYRQPGYLLVNDLSLPVQVLLQAYLDRWQIEVNHRDEKQLIGIVDAQVWNDRSVDRLPAFMVAAYSFLLLASLHAYGPERTEQYLQPPRWQKRRQRPSCLDMLHLLRQQACERPDLYGKVDFTFDPLRLATKLAA